MSKVIHRLSELTINKIAAGEVIENPASVVKELVENALDAGSTRIIVETTGGGLQKICISDDGIGMGPEDALLCLERHATSKIFEAEDLERIATMGFRGEALASIAAISKVTLQTCPSTGVGTQVEIEGGELVQVKPCARNRGTSLEVRQLFYNVPARRKFQKSAALCSLDILKTLTTLSLANPLIGFEYYENGQERLNLSKIEGPFLSALKKRAGDVLGDSFLADCVCVEAKFEPFSFQGILGGAQNTRPTKALQYSFINQRAVLCPAVSFAIKDAFGTRIAQDRFPIFALHLKIPFDFLDVNVHPQKKEVRIREEKWIKDKLQEKIQEELFVKERSMGSSSSSLSTAPVAFNLFSPSSFFAKKEVQEESFASFEEELPLFPKESLQMPLFQERKVSSIGIYNQYLLLQASSTSYLEMEIPQEGILMVDLKAASSRLLFDSLSSEESRDSLSLLIPISFSCSLPEAESLLHFAKDLEEMGFFLRSVGRQSFLIEAIPSLLPEEEAVDFLKIAFLKEKGDSWSLKKERLLASASSRLLSLRKEQYDLTSALEVFYKLMESKTPLFCPLGNKTILHIGNHELEQMFTKKRG